MTVRLAVATIVGALGLGARAAAQSEADLTHGGTASWARLKTGVSTWDRGIANDNALIAMLDSFLSLDLAPAAVGASADSVEELARYPVLLANELDRLSGPQADHLVEYLRRGGFLLLDVPLSIPSEAARERFAAGQLSVLTARIPKLRTVPLKDNDTACTFYFSVPDDPEPVHASVRALYDGDRLVGFLSFSWFQTASLAQHSARAAPTNDLMANLYLFAMLALRNRSYSAPRAVRY
jgi:hypothetical protein